jgi:hypothetical protein
MIQDWTHVSVGVKITDTCGNLPIIKQLSLQLTEDGDKTFVSVQSFELYPIMIIADAHDSNDLYEDVF